MRLQSKGIKNADTLLNPLRGPSSQTNPTSRKPSIPPTARTTPNTNHIATRQRTLLKNNRPPSPLSRYSSTPYQNQYQNQYPDDRALYNIYGTYDPYAAPPSPKGEHGLMGAVGGGRAGMVGGALLGDHPLVGALAGAHLDKKIEPRQERKKHEREEMFF
ncbi:hypothetical protein PMIN01_09115 [Paraphaeosphaeria minitans]|uniref:Uncharacterized protein n=1 Tax=Paraphaeosphaeria minitans TaxID=565426 RepID=A0A9P6KNV8_9PLEO|nr:hypothetical protein PMIN01_09115 [Paraphaeosphaeria minitans]